MNPFSKRRFARHLAVFTKADLAVFFILTTVLLATFRSSLRPLRRPPAPPFKPMVVEVIESDTTPDAALIFAFREHPDLPPLGEMPETDAAHDVLQPVIARIAERPFERRVHPQNIVAFLGSGRGDKLLDPAPPLFSEPVKPIAEYTPPRVKTKADALIFQSTDEPLPVVLINAPAWNSDRIASLEHTLLDASRSRLPTNTIERTTVEE